MVPYTKSFARPILQTTELHWYCAHVSAAVAVMPTAAMMIVKQSRIVFSPMTSINCDPGLIRFRPAYRAGWLMVHSPPRLFRYGSTTARILHRRPRTVQFRQRTEEPRGGCSGGTEREVILMR